MQYFDSAGVRIRYVDAGAPEGTPIVLVHGFASDYELNWVGSRWQEALAGAGFRVLGIDCRGHGHSGKPHDTAAYASELMAGDVVGLLDVLEVDRAHYLGYSMGGRLGLELVVRHPERFDRVALAGIGSRVLDRSPAGAELIARRLRGDATVHHPIADMFFAFASARPINDLEALASCITAPWSITRDDLLGIQRPVLIVAGDRDELVRGAPELAGLIPGARHVAVEGRNHMNAVPARAFKEAVLEFLAA